jgi:FdhD protein
MAFTGTRAYQGIKFDDSTIEEISDELTLEHPLSICIGGQPFTLTMHTPADEADLVRGLLYTEGIARKKAGTLEWQVIDRSLEGYISSINIPSEEADLKAAQLNKRSLLSVASCGICGKTELNKPFGTIASENGTLSSEHVQRMFDEMKKKQSAYLTGGGSHAAALFNRDFQLLVLREDIGRHNAVDKVIGALLNRGNLSDAHYLLVSGRVSYEIVVKCFAAGIPHLLAVSAPSSLAVDFCKELGISLYGFCRENRFTRYTNGI